MWEVQNKTNKSHYIDSENVYKHIQKKKQKKKKKKKRKTKKKKLTPAFRCPWYLKIS